MSKGGRKLIAAVREAIEDIKAGRFTLHKPPEKPVDGWKVDRDGRVYLPERKVVLKAKSTQ